MRLQKTVDDTLRKISMKTTRVVSDEHYLQLQESKPKMTVLEDELRMFIKDEDEFNAISTISLQKLKQGKTRLLINIPNNYSLPKLT